MSRQMPAIDSGRSYDVVIVGGGAAGLSGALTLGRARRSVLVVDAGQPRNAPAAHVHNFLSRDGTPPGDLLEAGRREVRGYGGEVVAGRAMSAAKVPDGFAVALDDGRTVRARRLLVTTGLTDELPDVPGVRERWGRDVLGCPYCHGWEVRDQAIGVLASGPLAVHQALLFRHWTPDLTLFLHTAPQPTDAEREQLAARDIAIIEGEVASLVVADDRLTGVRLRTDVVIPRQALVVAPRFAANADILVSLGLDVTAHPSGIGTYIAADAMGRTAVPGVWVAGNVADPQAQVIGAATAGLMAAAAINADLIAEEVQRAVAARRDPVPVAS
jgi:thioredoxin reductase